MGIQRRGSALSADERTILYMKECGKSTVLEVVTYTEKASMEGAKIALECGCDILMGTSYSDCVNEFCRQNHLKYMPFFGKVTGRPSILEGTVDGMIEEAVNLLKKGVYGFDLLGYRYTGDAAALINSFVSQISSPVCVAGSINTYKRLD